MTTSSRTRTVVTFIMSGRCGSCSARWPCPSACSVKTGQDANTNVRIGTGIVEIRSFIILTLGRSVEVEREFQTSAYAYWRSVLDRRVESDLLRGLDGFFGQAVRQAADDLDIAD